VTSREDTEIRNAIEDFWTEILIEERSRIEAARPVTDDSDHATDDPGRGIVRREESAS
jgi:hypothetical protein